MENYEFTAIWHPSTESPPSGTRCIVTDGDLVTFGTYVVDGDKNSVWLLPEFEAAHPFNVIGWMESPKPMPKRIVYNDETPVVKN